jgi:hypothetical protein
MHIGIVGGLDRAEERLERIAADAGHTVEFHTGHTHTRGAAQLEALVARCDLILLLTDINSHGGVQLTRKLATQRGRRLVLMRRLGIARFAELIGEVGQLAQRVA